LSFAYELGRTFNSKLLASQKVTVCKKYNIEVGVSTITIGFNYHLYSVDIRILFR
jgi:hypothetical protein